ncbi:MAG: DUF3440 domain-containing protein [Clostridia bacterium]|nr:DUF3440 domain-containing protein [Clostridia bacterium]
MQKQFVDLNVYEALQSRLDFLFAEFENIVVSFSGGKDSGLLLNLVMDYAERNGIDTKKRIAVFHQDFEAQYSFTTEYVTRTFERLRGRVKLYWVCLPMATRTALSNYEMYWYPWDDTKEELWIRPMPQGEYVINLKNNPITTYKYRMTQESLAKQFGHWYSEEHEGKTAMLLGIRADESLSRYSGIINKKYGYKDQCYITESFRKCWTASPIYDWTVADVWTANYLFGFDYNKLYDLYFKAGVPFDKMRVASPFNEWAVESLNLYRVIEPMTWNRLVGRVRGVNFGAIYGKTKAMGFGRITLPEGYTWEEYTKFLLSTLPPELRNNYIRKFVTSIEFWHKTGGGLSDETIAELRAKGYRIGINGVSNYTVKHYSKVVFLDKIPDHTDNIKSTKDIPSWKRMCICILKNDHLCKTMGFGISREQQAIVNAIKKKYGNYDKEL